MKPSTIFNRGKPFFGADGSVVGAVPLASTDDEDDGVLYVNVWLFTFRETVLFISIQYLCVCVPALVSNLPRAAAISGVLGEMTDFLFLRIVNPSCALFILDQLFISNV